MKFLRSIQAITFPLLLLILLSNGCSKNSSDDADSSKSETKTPAAVSTDTAVTIVAQVNDSEINSDELNKEVTRIQQRFYAAGKMSSTQKDSLKKEILEILINNELLYQASQQIDITVSDEEIENDLKNAKELYPDTDKFNNTFTAEDIRKKLFIEKFISAEFSDKTVITDEIAQKYYQDNINDFTRPEQALVSHILISVEDMTDENQKKQALDKITDIQSQINNGGSFSELADQYSDDPKKMQGGQIGYVVRGQLDPDFENAVFSLEVEQVSDIVETKFGFHLIKITEKKERYVFPFDEISDKLKAFLKQKEVQRKIDTYIKTQREKAAISRNI